MYSKYTPNSRCCPLSWLLAVLAMFLDNISPWNEYHVSPTVPPFCLNNQNNSTSSPGFLGQWFDMTVQYDKLLNWWRFEYFEWIIISFMLNFIFSFSQLKPEERKIWCFMLIDQAFKNDNKKIKRLLWGKLTLYDSYATNLSIEKWIYIAWYTKLLATLIDCYLRW